MNKTFFLVNKTFFLIMQLVVAISAVIGYGALLVWAFNNQFSEPEWEVGKVEKCLAYVDDGRWEYFFQERRVWIDDKKCVEWGVPTPLPGLQSMSSASEGTPELDAERK